MASKRSFSNPLACCAISGSLTETSANGFPEQPPTAVGRFSTELLLESNKAKLQSTVCICIFDDSKGVKSTTVLT